MGNLYSKPSEDDIIKTNRVLNNILQFMVKESDLLDMYDLASEKSCQQYTILTEKSLEKYFKKIQLHPYTENGKFYFQRLDVLAKLPGKYKKEQTTACYDLSRFYVRILHIFASISITILDGEFPKSDQVLKDRSKERATRRQVNDRTFTTAPFVKGSQKLSGFWGTPSTAIPNVNVVNIRENENDDEPEPEPESENDPRPLTGGALPPSTRDPKLFYQIKNQNYEILNTYLSIFSSTHFKFDGTNIKVPIKSLFTPALTPTSYPEEVSPISYITVEYSGTYDKSITPFVFIAKLQIEKKNDTTHTMILQIERPRDKLATQSVNFISIGGSEPRYKRLTISSYIQSIIDSLSGKSKLSIKNLNRRTRRTISNIGKNTTIPDYFKVVPILKGLTSKPPIVAYCPSRAAQLISPDAYHYSQAEQATTYICDPSFKLLNKSDLPGSLPSPRGTILNSRGISSLDKLFYNKFNDTKTIAGISQRVQGEYNTFKVDMQALYEGRKEISTSKISIGNIKNIPNADICKKNGALITRDPDVISNLRAKANVLINLQNAHYKDAMKILNKLFIISDTRPILLNPLIEEGGIEAVEEVAKEARELLIRYYTDCELEYRRGVDYINEKKAAFT
jgi:hypothetical protein